MGIFDKLFGKKTEKDQEIKISEKQMAGFSSDVDKIKSGEITKIYPILKPGDWIGIKAKALRSTLIGTQEDPKLVIGFGYDAENSFIFLTYDDLAKRKIESILEEAYQNLEDYEVPINEVVPGKVAIIDGEDFCSEKILDKKFMRAMHQKLNSDKLLVSIPRRRCMMMSSEFEDEKIIDQFMSVHNSTWNDPSYGNALIINELFQVENGEIVGTIDMK